MIVSTFFYTLVRIHENLDLLTLLIRKIGHCKDLKSWYFWVLAIGQREGLMLETPSRWPIYFINSVSLSFSHKKAKFKCCLRFILQSFIMTIGFVLIAIKLKANSEIQIKCLKSSECCQGRPSSISNNISFNSTQTYCTVKVM